MLKGECQSVCQRALIRHWNVDKCQVIKKKLLFIMEFYSPEKKSAVIWLDLENCH